jgi:phenol/toluene 2-monooxygenase (NADH) P5/A5
MSYQVTIEPLGQTIAVNDGQTILDACLRAGVWLPHACCHGLCGTCKVQVLEGEFDHGNASNFALMDFERDEQKMLACSAMPQSDLVIEADIDEDPDAKYLPLDDYNASVTEIRDLTPTIKGIWLKTDHPVRFQAGQYVNLQIPGVEGPRAFSIASPPGENIVELHVRRVQDGAATTWLHEQLKSGDQLQFTAPLGRFFVRESAQVPMIFLAGGSGLSSPKSMIVDLLQRGSNQAIALFQGARSEDELYFADFFTQLAQQYKHFTYIPVLSDIPAGNSWKGARGFVHEELKRRYLAGEHADFRGHKAYLCGPPPMIEACIATLMQGRLFERDIYTEKFLTAADAEAQAKRSPLFKNL